MCGRYSLVSTSKLLTAHFGVQFPPFDPDDDIAPGSVEPIITEHGVAAARWGLVPAWLQGDPAFSSFNARAETLTIRPMFRNSFLTQRCMVPVNGFFEFKPNPGDIRKLKYRCSAPDSLPLALAGLWDHREETTFTIITTASCNPVHDRLPVILDRSFWRLWLDPHSPIEDVKTLLRPAMYPLRVEVA